MAAGFIQWAPSMAGRGVGNALNDLYRNQVPDYPDVNIPVVFTPTLAATPPQGPTMTVAPSQTLLSQILEQQTAAQKAADKANPARPSSGLKSNVPGRV